MNVISKTCSLLLLTCISFSCQETDKERISHLVKEWDGKEIQFPNNPIFTRMVEDTVPYRIPKSDYK